MSKVIFTDCLPIANKCSVHAVNYAILILYAYFHVFMISIHNLCVVIFFNNKCDCLVVELWSDRWATTQCPPGQGEMVRRDYIRWFVSGIEECHNVHCELNPHLSNNTLYHFNIHTRIFSSVINFPKLPYFLHLIFWRVVFSWYTREHNFKKVK